METSAALFDTEDPDLQDWKWRVFVLLMIFCPIALIVIMDFCGISFLWLFFGIAIFGLVADLCSSTSCSPSPPPVPAQPRRSRARDPGLIILAMLAGWWLGGQFDCDDADLD